MAKKKDFTDLGDKLDKLLEFMVADANKTTKAKEDSQKAAQGRRDSQSREKLGKELESSERAVKDSVIGVVENTASLVGLTASMASLKGVLGDLKGMNSRVSKSLAQVHLSTEGSSKTLSRFDNSNTGLSQQIETFADVVDLGMSRFSDDTLKFATQLKAQGIGQKAVLAAMRTNTQVLGMSETASLELADSLVSTAGKNGDSIDGLISALDSMKDAMVSTTVALGPEAAANMQRVAAMIGQHNSGLQDSAAAFVSSFLNGTEGFQKAARLGVQFTGQESTEDFAAKVGELIDRVNDLTVGMKGAGSQPAIEAIVDKLNISYESINFAQQMAGWAPTSLVDGMTAQTQADLSKNSMDQAYQNATRNTQKKGLTVTEGIASMIQKIGTWGGGHFLGMAASLGFIIGNLMAINTSIGLLIAAQAKASGMDMLPGKKGRLGKMFSGLTGKMGKFGMKMKYASSVFGRNFLSMYGGKGSTTLLKKAGGIIAKGAGKVLGPIAAIATGVMKANEEGKTWVDGLKRGATSMAIWGAGIALAPVTGGASLVGAAALDALAGDRISEALPGGGESVKSKPEKLTTAQLAKKTTGVMTSMGVTKEAGFSQDELERIATLTQENLRFNEEVKDMTRERLIMTKAELEEKRATPITLFSNFLAQNMIGMNTLITQNEIANEQRADQTGVIANGSQPGFEPITAGGML